MSGGWEAAYDPDAGLPFDPDALERRLVWIFGSPRTGSTWLLRQLCDPLRLDAGAPLGFLPPHADPDATPGALPLDEFLIAHHLVPETGPPAEWGAAFVPTSVNTFMGDRNNYAFAKAFSGVWGPELRRLILVRIAAMVDAASEAGLSIPERAPILIKEVNGSHAAPEIMELFPGSRLILLARDGRDVIDSRIHARGPGGWLTGRDGPAFEGPEERLEWVRGEARRWAMLTDMSLSAYERHAEDRRRIVRYEELRGATAGTLAELGSWLEIPHSLERWSAIAERHSFEALPEGRSGPTRSERAAEPGLWRRHLTVAEQEATEELVLPRLVALGYPER